MSSPDSAFFPGIHAQEITDFSIPELDVYFRCSESQLLHLLEPDVGYFLAESPRVVLRAMDAGFLPESMVIAREDAANPSEDTRSVLARCAEQKEDFPVHISDASVLKKELGYPLNRGLLCSMRRRVLPSVQDVCRDARRIAVLDGVVNPSNVGAIFRSAAAMQIDAVLLTPDCSDPLYRRSLRVSMGTVFQIPWTIVGADKYHAYSGKTASIADREKTPAWTQQLHELGFAAAAMALRSDSVSIRDKRLAAEPRLAIALGNEGDGLRPEIIRDCDYTVRIPMAPGIDSLNVAAASAVAFWELARISLSEDDIPSSKASE